MTIVRIVDYGIGNLHSVHRALSTWSDDVATVRIGSDLHEATHLVLPGVGAFGAAMNEVRIRKLEPQLRDFAHSGRPILGLCVGMQILADVGFEDGFHDGLGLIPGRVVSLRERSPNAVVPNIGWRDVDESAGGSGLFTRLHTSDTYYFAHSYELIPNDPSDIAATTGFGGRNVVAAVRRGNIMGLQFHPEKSGRAGLALLRRFLETM